MVRTDRQRWYYLKTDGTVGSTTGVAPRRSAGGERDQCRLSEALVGSATGWGAVGSATGLVPLRSAGGERDWWGAVGIATGGSESDMEHCCWKLIMISL